MIVPLIGITTYPRNAENRFTLPAEYVDAVRRAGGIPVLIAPGEIRGHELLARLDGIILAGGGDIEPTHYNGAAHETIFNTDAERDRSELALTARLLQLDLPTLCICRGMQVVNVALGGALIEHIPDEAGEEVLHRLPPHQGLRHPVRVEADSRLAAIMGTTDAAPLSWHHQALRTVGEGLTVVATAADGTIEAVEMAGHAWLIAVQWHPELTAAVDADQQRIFDALIEACQQCIEE